MAIQNFIDGALYGKIGGFVGANWRGIDYMRAYAKPKQPDSPAQVLHKQNFKRLITIANTLHKIWFPLVFDEKPNKTLSNQFMTLNKGIYKTDGFNYLIEMPYNNSHVVGGIFTQGTTETTRTFRFGASPSASPEGNILGLLALFFFPEDYYICPVISKELNSVHTAYLGENWQQKKMWLLTQIVTDKYIYAPIRHIVN